MKLSLINSGFFKLDGGAMFGVVPYSLWSKLNPPDDRNLCTWAMRCLLIESGDRKILIDTGLGNKQSEKFMSHFEPHGNDTIPKSLDQAQVTAEQITDVFLTHLHFDHVGGALIKDAEGNVSPQFPNATYWSNKTHFDWAYTPNERERASFLKENFVPLEEHGLMKYVEEVEGVSLFEGFDIHFVNGHTEAMMTPHIHLPNGNTIIYCADLMPSSFHIRKPYVMAYDIRPLDTLREREQLYKIAVQENVYLFFEHDPIHPMGKLKINDRGRYYVDTDVDLEAVLA